MNVPATPVSAIESKRPAYEGVDRIERSVRLLVGLVAGFGSSTPPDSVKAELRTLGRGDAHVVLSELSKNDSYVSELLDQIYPDVLSILREKVSG